MTRRRAGSRRRASSSGFSLIELVIATLLSSIVLMSMFSVTSNMVAAEVNGMRAGTVTAYSLAGISAMNTDIAGASAIGFPAPGNNSPSLVVCSNWSTRETPPGPAQTAAQGGGGNDVYSFCWDTAEAAPLGNTLLRNKVHNAAGGETCPAVAKAPCTVATYTDAFFPSPIIATGVYQDLALDPIFYTDNKTLNAVRIRYAVGNPNANVGSAGGSAGQAVAGQNAVPVSVSFNTEILLED